jgi:hypothetical protein
MRPESPDPVLAALSDLAAPAPREARDALVRARCHAAMTATVRQPKRLARAAGRAFDLLLPVAAALYGVTIVVEALRIIASLR